MTTYRRAFSPEDYEQCHTLLREEKQPEQLLGFPTMMAFEDDRLIGICGTHIVDEMIIAGPLVLRTDRRRAFTALELCVKYEEDLIELGIKSYIFSAENGTVMAEAVSRYMHGMEPYAEENNRKFYVRKLDGTRQDIPANSEAVSDGLKGKGSGTDS